jgi:hypothetical protein
MIALRAATAAAAAVYRTNNVERFFRTGYGYAACSSKSPATSSLALL